MAFCEHGPRKRRNVPCRRNRVWRKSLDKTSSEEITGVRETLRFENIVGIQKQKSATNSKWKWT